MADNERGPSTSPNLAPSHRVCPLCGAPVPDGFANCRAVFDEVCAQEYAEPGFGAAHLLTVDAYALQHSEEHGPRSNAFHLMRLMAILEFGAEASLGHRPPRDVGKALESRYRTFPDLEPPRDRGALTIADVFRARGPAEHEDRVRAWARSVLEAYRPHHAWARRALSDPGMDA